MKTNELRIGNYIGQDGNILIVEKIDIQNNIGCSLFEKAKGQHVNSGNKYFIPLTEEWLLKLGFYECHGWYRKNNLEIYKVKNYLYIPRFNIGLEHVHQIQNLYFALTGEELTINN